MLPPLSGGGQGGGGRWEGAGGLRLVEVCGAEPRGGAPGVRGIDCESAKSGRARWGMRFGRAPKAPF